MFRTFHESSSTSASAVSTILLVDDTELNLDLLSRRLERDGYAIVCAVDGAQALARLRERRIDLVLLDIMMPVMDDYQVLEAIKTDL